MTSPHPEASREAIQNIPQGSISARVKYFFSDYWQNLKLFSHNIRLYLAGAFLIGLTFAAYQLLLNLYLRDQGMSESFIGRILSLGALGMTLAAIPAAFYLRKIRLKKVLLVTAIVYPSAILVLTHLPMSNWLLVCSFLAGLSLTFYRIAACPFFLRNTTPKERTYVFSMSFGTMLIASMIGSIVFGWMVSFLTGTLNSEIAAYRWTFVFSVLLGFAAVIPFMMIKAADPSKEDREADLSLNLLKRQFRLYSKLFIPYFMVGTGAGLIIPFLNIYFKDRFGQPPDKIGLFYTLVNATMFLGILAGPVLARKLGMIRAIVSTQLLSIPFMVVLAFTHSLPVAFAAFLIRGALMNLGSPIGSNFGMEMVGQSEHALVNALLTLAWTGSWMISAQIGGSLIEHYGYTLPLLLAVGLYIVSSLMYFWFFKDSEKKTMDGFVVRMPANK